jgi:hypothetical protein
VVLGKTSERSGRREAGISEEGVDVSGFGLHALVKAVQVRGIGNVTRNRDRGLTKGSGDFLKLCLAASGDVDAGYTFVDELFSRSEANA